MSAVQANGVFVLTTTLGAHRVAHTLQAEAWLLGLEADVQTSGGLFEKVHRVSVRGPSDTVRRFVIAAERWINKMGD